MGVQELLNAPFLNGLFSCGFSRGKAAPLRALGRNRGSAPLRTETCDEGVTNGVSKQCFSEWCVQRVVRTHKGRGRQNALKH